MENILFVVLAILLVVLNGFFVAAEFGIVTLRKTRVRAIAKTTGLRGRILMKVHDKLDAYLSACQLGITLASLGLGWVGEPAFASLLEPVFGFVGVTSPQIIHGVSFVVAFSVISFLHIVVGELAPKSLAIRIPEVVALWTALPLYGFYWAMYPAIWVLNASANGVLRVAGRPGRQRQPRDALFDRRIETHPAHQHQHRPGKIHPRRAPHPGAVARVFRNGRLRPDAPD